MCNESISIKNIHHAENEQKEKKQILDKYAKKSSHIKEFTEIITLKLQGRHIVLPTCHKQQRAMFRVG